MTSSASPAPTHASPGADPASPPSAPAVLPAALARRLRDVVGPGAVVTDPDRLLVYESDALGRHHQTPLAVVLPSDTEEAAAVVRAVHDAGLAIVPRGAGTGLSGGAVAAPGSVMLGTARMNRVLSFDPSRRVARVQAGVRNSQLASLVRPRGLVYAPDPSSQAACTLGGNVAENSGGPHCLKYGVTRRYVQGLTLVDGDGHVVEIGGASRPRGDALDLLGPVVGSEGCFGLVTEIELGLVPETESVRTLLGLFETTAEAGEAVTAIISDGLLPAALEIIDRHTISAVEGSPYRAGYPQGVGAALVVEFDGRDLELDADAARAERHCLEAGATEVRRATDAADRLRLWQGRKKAFGTMGRLAPDLMVQDATVPRSILPEVLRRIDEVAERYDLRIANVFHAGDGNLHPNILYDRRDEALTARVERAAGEIMKICVDAGGTITGEHGVGLDKREYVRLIAGPDEIAAMSAVRDAYDPDGRWNPGKVLPDADGVAPEAEAPGAGAPAGFVPPEPVTRVEVSAPDLSVRTPGDVPWGEVLIAMAADGQWSPISAGRPDLSVADALRCELGPLEAVYGPIRESVLGATVTTRDGRRLRLGGRVVKNVAGFDLLGLFLGPGALGRIEEATLRSYPMPDVLEVLRWPVGGPRAALPGWPHAQVVARGVHAVLLSGTSAWVDHERARLTEACGTPMSRVRGVDAMRGFVRAFDPADRGADDAAATETDAAARTPGPEARGPAVEHGPTSIVEVRPGPVGEEAERFRQVVASVSASRWAWDPTLRRGRIATVPGEASLEEWTAVARTLASEGGGCAVVTSYSDAPRDGTSALRDALRSATRHAHPAGAGVDRIEARLRAAFGADRASDSGLDSASGSAPGTVA